MALIKCPECKSEVSDKAKSCPKCGCPIDDSVRCIKCGSKNVETISGVSKGVSVLLWGPFAAGKILSKYNCKDCKHKF